MSPAARFEVWLAAGFLFIVAVIIIGFVSGQRGVAEARQGCEDRGGTYVETAEYDGFCASPGTLR